MGKGIAGFHAAVQPPRTSPNHRQQTFNRTKNRTRVYLHYGTIEIYILYFRCHADTVGLFVFTAAQSAAHRPILTETLAVIVTRWRVLHAYLSHLAGHFPGARV